MIRAIRQAWIYDTLHYWIRNRHVLIRDTLHAWNRDTLHAWIRDTLYYFVCIFGKYWATDVVRASGLAKLVDFRANVLIFRASGLAKLVGLDKLVGLAKLLSDLILLVFLTYIH